MQMAGTMDQGGRVSWRHTVWPKEHGSWSLAFEPLALGLLAAPSPAGAALGVAVAAGFFCRRPLRIALADKSAARRRAARTAVLLCAAVALAALAVAVSMGGVAWMIWLLPTVIGGVAFLNFDLKQAGREQQAEVAGAFAFAWLPAVFAALAGWPFAAAVALGAIMLARSVPTVLAVRSAVRARKTKTAPARWPVLVAGLALALVTGFALAGAAPRLAVVATAVLAVRAFLLLVWPRPLLRASTLGMIEAILGLGFVAAVGFSR